MKHLLHILFLLLLTLAPVGRVCADVTIADGRVLTEEQLDSLRQTEDFVTTSLVVAEPTDWHDDMIGVIGHAFIRLQCPTFAYDYCFSYEGESAKENIQGLLKGNLKMGLYRFKTEGQIEAYKYWGIALHEYTLNMPADAELRLWEIMDNHVNNGNKLKVDMYKRGCAISLLHFVKEALGDDYQIVYTEWPEIIKASSQYEVLAYYLNDFPWIFLALKMTGTIDSRFEKECDNEEKLLVPVLLAEVWQKATLNDKPFAVYKEDLVVADPVVVEKTVFTPTIALILLLLLVGCGISVISWRKYKRKKA